MASKLLTILIIIDLGFSYDARYGGELYQDGKNARNESMGGLSVSYEDGSNPVFLKNTKSPSIHFSHKNKFGGIAQVTILSYLHMGKKYPLYLGLKNRSVDDIPDTRQAWIDNGNSIPESGEINYINIHDIVQQEIGIQLSTIRSLGLNTLGFTIKPIITTLAEFKSFGISTDFAVMVEPLDKVDLTFRIEDVMWLKYWNFGTIETIPPLCISGMHYQGSRLRMGVEAGSQIKSNSRLNYHMGIEYKLQEQLFFRMGTSHSNQFTAGFGIHLTHINFSYAYLHPDNYSPFEESFIISVAINLDNLNRIKDKITP